MDAAACRAAYLRFWPPPRGLVATMRHTPAMSDDLDFRSDKSETTEGGRVAANRWAG